MTFRPRRTPQRRTRLHPKTIKLLTDQEAFSRRETRGMDLNDHAWIAGLTR